MNAVQCSMSFLIRNESALLNVFGIETRLTMCENMAAISGLTRCSSAGARAWEARAAAPSAGPITAFTQISSEDSHCFNTHRDGAGTQCVQDPHRQFQYLPDLDVEEDYEMLWRIRDIMENTIQLCKNKIW